MKSDLNLYVRVVYSGVKLMIIFIQQIFAEIRQIIVQTKLKEVHKELQWPNSIILSTHFYTENWYLDYNSSCAIRKVPKDCYSTMVY